ncbi:calcium-activated potassium channel subunit beta-4-like isoform X2 [Pseudochaenichthys georgianus]|uniref:calcium-activated potassium channel subunit beta-4-like isoform X2 n=1 Tax=Pseudochaenichthys georgianus TaxID=52239 RepID=UPI00146F31CB|nr:calcium-activated potassium channel subunit beta-4-like isoform X2 [Pseudochaenichthys georgianus]
MAKIRVSYEYSEAEDKSIRLGLFLIACGILSLFILGFCWLSPTLQSLQSKPANCTVVSVLRPEEMFECIFTCGADCKGTSLYPCLQIFVNNSESNSVALLHFDEQQLVLNPKCSYVPPCERDNQKNRDSVLWWEDYFTREAGRRVVAAFPRHQRAAALRPVADGFSPARHAHRAPDRLRSIPRRPGRGAPEEEVLLRGLPGPLGLRVLGAPRTQSRRPANEL